MVLDLQPVLSSELLLLRPLADEDYEALHQIAADPGAWEQHPAKDRTQEPVFRAWFADALASRGQLAAIDRAEDTAIGTSRFVLRGPDRVEIGWTFLARSRWGGGWNGQMKRLMLEHAFASVSTVVFVVHSANHRSQRAVQRLGAQRVGTAEDEHGRGENVVFHLRPGDLAQEALATPGAAAHLRLGREAASALGDDGYGAMINAGLDRPATRLDAR